MFDLSQWVGLRKDFKSFLLVGALLFFPWGAPSQLFAQDQACVILIHGLARTEKSMTKMVNALEQANYFVINEGYNSRRHSIEKLAKERIPKWVERCETLEKQPIHIVTHSLGGILLRYHLSQAEIKELGRVVMLGPPNQGSEVVDKLKFVPGFFWLNGPAGRQLGTSDTDMPKQLGPVDFDLGVIAGTQSMNLILSMFLPNPDDGKVSVASTQVAGMCSFLAMPVTHPFLMQNSRVIEEVIHYLETGRFVDPGSENDLC